MGCFLGIRLFRFGTLQIQASIPSGPQALVVPSPQLSKLPPALKGLDLSPWSSWALMPIKANLDSEVVTGN